ncbi:class I SAM-dependent methyltransferase [Benzoatithermus flavus]|uniref:Class I SAM-dependent methyltransferase n=1 Tax=Benzoatithermus flavus TaxID=3108223 RepID=A0ABU8XRU5_9PROT
MTEPPIHARRPPATTVEEVHAVVKGYPYTDLANGRILYEFIRRHELRRVLELGVCHGVSACYAAAAVASLGGGRVVAIDRLEVAAYRPGILDFSRELGFESIIVPFFERATYNWRLRDFLRLEPRPVFDLVFLDGAHTWEPDSLAFLLSEKLLRPGGWWILDDLNWSIGTSPTARRVAPGQITLAADEIEALQVRDVIDLVVRPHPNVASWSENGKWGFARKKTLEEMAAEDRLGAALRERAAATLLHARENFPEPIEVPPDLRPEAWQRTIHHGLERNRNARLARSGRG